MLSHGPTHRAGSPRYEGFATRSWSRVDAARARPAAPGSWSKAPAPDRRGQCGVPGEPEPGHPIGVGPGNRRSELHLAFDHEEHVAGDPGVEPGSAVGAPEAWPRGVPAPLRPARPRSDARTARPVGREVDGRSIRLPVVSSQAQEDEEVPLALAHPSTDGRQLHRPGGPAQVGGRLEGADHRPLDRGVGLPPPDPSGADRLPAGGRVRRRATRRGSPNPPTWPGAAESPRPGAQPADVLGGVAGVGQLPVEDGTEARRGRPAGCPCGSRRAP